MRLNADLVISNRCMPKSKSKNTSTQALITLGRKENNENLTNNKQLLNENLYLMINTAKDNCYGTSYRVVNFHRQKSKARHKNLLNLEIFDRFSKEGRVTLRFLEPEHDVLISNADPILLRQFLNILKSAQHSPQLEQLSSLKPVSKSQIPKYTSKLYINKRQDYPSNETGFPQMLKKLQIENLQMKKIDLRIPRLKHLMSLDLSGNVIKDIPVELTALESLKELNLANNRIKRIPHRFCQNEQFCDKLLLLNLEGNCLTELPSNLTNFLNLVTLNVKNNFFSHLPHGLFQKMTKLRFLYLSGCKYLECLPTTFFDTHRLDVIHADRLPKIFRRMDYRNYMSGCHEEVIMDTTKNVPSLFDIASAFTIEHKLLWESVRENENLIPSVIKQYLKTLVKCYCQSSCLPSSCLRKVLRFRIDDVMKLVTRDLITDVPNGTANFECIFCSQKCKNRFVKTMNLSPN